MTKLGLDIITFWPVLAAGVCVVIALKLASWLILNTAINWRSRLLLGTYTVPLRDVIRYPGLLPHKSNCCLLRIYFFRWTFTIVDKGDQF